VADPWKAIVFRAYADAQRPGAGTSEKSRGQIADPVPNREPGIGQRLTELGGCLLLLETEFRVGMDTMAKLSQAILD